MAINNNYLEMQIMNQIQMADNFKNTCRIAFQKEDGVIDKDERKILDKLTKETDTYIKNLQKILK